MSAGSVSHLFFSKESQYLASSSGDLLDDWAILVTALLLMNRPHACKKTNETDQTGRKHDDLMECLFHRRRN